MSHPCPPPCQEPSERPAGGAAPRPPAPPAATWIAFGALLTVVVVLAPALLGMRYAEPAQIEFDFAGTTAKRDADRAWLEVSGAATIMWMIAVVGVGAAMLRGYAWARVALTIVAAALMLTLIGGFAIDWFNHYAATVMLQHESDFPTESVGATATRVLMFGLLIGSIVAMYRPSVKAYLANAASVRRYRSTARLRATS